MRRVAVRIMAVRRMRVRRMAVWIVAVRIVAVRRVAVRRMAVRRMRVRRRIKAQDKVGDGGDSATRLRHVVAASIADHGRGAEMSCGGRGHGVDNQIIGRAIVEGMWDAHRRRGVDETHEAGVRRRRVPTVGHRKAE